MSRLAAGEINDEAGMASTVLAAEVGYPGSSIAFAQLLSGMERSGLIERTVRGKRTYRIAAADALTAGPGATDPTKTGLTRSGLTRASANGSMDAVTGRRPVRRGQAADRDSGPPATRPGQDGGRHLAAAAEGAGDFDYDELARRLLIQVVRQLAAAPGPAQARHGDTSLEKTVASLEQELASVRTLHGSLTQENAKLREQLGAARKSLALAQERPAGQQVTGELDAAEVSLLGRLLAPSPAQPGREDAGTG